MRQWVSLPNRDAVSQDYHQNSNEGNGGHSGLAEGQKDFGAEANDVVLAKDSLDTRGNFKYKELEGHVSEEAPRITHQDEHISNYTPKDKNSKLGFNPQAGGVGIQGRFILGRGGAKRNQIWAFFPLIQDLYHTMETHNSNTQTL